MEPIPIEFIFSEIPRKKRRKVEYQVEILIPIEHSPHIISYAGKLGELYAIGLAHDSTRRHALRFRLSPEDIFATGPHDIDVLVDDIRLRITVRDVEGLLPKEWERLPRRVTGELQSEFDSFTVMFGY